MDNNRNRSLPLTINEKISSFETTGFRLYIKGMYPDSVRALILARAICERYPKGRCGLEIVDTLNEPERMSADNITDIPALVRLSPLSIIGLSGDMEDPEQIIRELGLQ